MASGNLNAKLCQANPFCVFLVRSGVFIVEEFTFGRDSIQFYHILVEAVLSDSGENGFHKLQRNWMNN